MGINVLPSVFSPNHFVDDADVALDDFDDFGADVFIDVVGDGDAVVTVAAEADGGVHCLEEAGGVDAGDDEVAFVDCLGTLGTGADADGGEGMTDAGEETALFGEGAAVTDDGEGVHLETVVVVETEGVVADDAFIEFESAGVESVAASGMATVEDGHVVFLRHFVDGCEEAEEVFIGVDVFLAVGGEEDVAFGLEVEAGEDVGGFNLG